MDYLNPRVTILQSRSKEKKRKTKKTKQKTKRISQICPNLHMWSTRGSVPLKGHSNVNQQIDELAEVPRLPAFPRSKSSHNLSLYFLSSSSASPVGLTLPLPKDHDLSVTLFGTTCLKKGFRTGTQAQMRPVLTSIMLQRKVSAASHGRSSDVRSRTAQTKRTMATAQFLKIQSAWAARGATGWDGLTQSRS